MDIAGRSALAFFLEKIKFTKNGQIPEGGILDDLELVLNLPVGHRTGGFGIAGVDVAAGRDVVAVAHVLDPTPVGGGFAGGSRPRRGSGRARHGVCFLAIRCDP